MMMSNAGDMSGVPLPPAITRESVVSEVPRSGSATPLPPYVPGAGHHDPSAAITRQEVLAAESAPREADSATAAPASEEPLPWESSAATSATGDDGVEPGQLELTEVSEPAAAESVEWPDMRGEDEGDAMRPWDDGTEIGEFEEAVRADERRGTAKAEADGSDAAGDFPLDAFFVPLDSQRVPTGYDEAAHREVAERVAGRLESLAQAVRTRGMTALGATRSSDHLTTLIAAVVAGYYARER
jgi:hypothetical protein